MPPVGFKPQIIAALPGTKAKIAKQTGLSNSTTLKWIGRMHEACEIHIAEWHHHPRAGGAMAVYELGPGVDAVCTLRHLTKKEIRTRYEAKAKEDGRYDVVRARMRNQYWKRKAAQTPQTWASALLTIVGTEVSDGR